MQIRAKRRALVAAMATASAVGLVGLWPSDVEANSYSWVKGSPAGSGTQDWFTGSNWSGGVVPVVGTGGFDGDDITINANSSLAQPVLVTGGANPTAGGKQLFIGSGVGTSGYLEVDSGTFSSFAFGATAVIGGSGTGVFIQTGGSATIKNQFANVVLGDTATGNGSISVSGGSFNIGASSGFIVGNSGTGNFSVTGSGVTANTIGMTVGNNGTGVGTVTLGLGATITLGTNNVTTIGNAGAGTMNITGGTMSSSGTNGKLVIGTTGLIQGYGTISGLANVIAAVSGGVTTYSTGLQLSGRIIADGGVGNTTDRTLALSGVFSNTVDNTPLTGINGVYARNHAKLTDLVGIAANLPSGSAISITFAESPAAGFNNMNDADGKLDMVNSARFNFNTSGTGGPGTATVSLLSPDRNDAVQANGDAAGLTFIGMWNIVLVGANTQSSPDYAFRYDNIAAGGATPSLFVLNGGTWTLVTNTTLDIPDSILETTSSQVIGANMTFAVGADVPVPEPTAFGLVSLSGIALLRRRRRNNALRN